MLPYLCDTPDRLTSRVYRILQVECGCCTFYRGVALGSTLGAGLAVVGIIAAALVYAAVFLR